MEFKAESKTSFLETFKNIPHNFSEFQFVKK